MNEFIVKENLNKDDLEFLRSIGFITSTSSPFKQLGNFELILNPCMSDGNRKVIINYLNEDYYGTRVDEHIYAHEIFSIITALLFKKIIEVKQ